MRIFKKNKNNPKFFGGGTLTTSVKEGNGVLNDKCVICGADTGVPQNTPITERKRYISGSGQLCSECYLELYIKSDSGNAVTPTDAEMQRLLEMSRKE